MKTLLILGAGTGGTMVANKLVHELDPQEWEIIVVDRDETHYYQPGFFIYSFWNLFPPGCLKTQARFYPPRCKTYSLGYRNY